MTIHKVAREQLSAQINQSERDESAQLNNALRFLSKWSSVLIQNTLIKHQGTVVMQGPLAGMDFLTHSAEGCHIAKLLGCYEQPLHAFIEEAIVNAYTMVLTLYSSTVGMFKLPIVSP